MTIQNRYTRKYQIVANPAAQGGVIAELELAQPEPLVVFDASNRAVLTHLKTHDMFMLSERFNPSARGFRQQLLAEIRGISDKDARFVAALRKVMQKQHQDFEQTIK